MKEKNSIRIIGLILLIAVLLVVIGGTVKAKVFPKESNSPEDVNVYLGEEILFGQDYQISVVGMLVDKEDNQEAAKDADGDILSPYCLNLKIQIKKVSNKKWGEIQFESEMFKLKNVNLKSKSKMAVFFEALFKNTVEMSLSMVVDGEVNIIDSAVGFVGEYLTEISENVVTESQFKPIKATKNQFDKFKLPKVGDEKEVSISFPIKQEYLESEKTIVLTIDKWNCVERRIYLVKRPTQSE